jgi:high-affinity nickel permease
MTVLLWIYFISMAIIAIFAFTNKEATGVKVGKVTISTIVSTLLIAVIPIVNTMVIIGYICAKWADWRMTRRMTKKD